jgi:hypothetical protein
VYYSAMTHVARAMGLKPAGTCAVLGGGSYRRNRRKLHKLGKPEATEAAIDSPPHPGGAFIDKALLMQLI